MPFWPAAAQADKVRRDEMRQVTSARLQMRRIDSSRIDWTCAAISKKEESQNGSREATCISKKLRKAV